MCKLFNEWSDEIKKYCEENNFSFEKANRLAKGCGKDFLFLQYHNPDKGNQGLLDETPMPLVLMIRSKNSKLIFEQTEHTREYLS